MILINLLPTKKKKKQLGIKQELLLAGLLLALTAVLLGLAWSWQNRTVEQLTLAKGDKQRTLEQLKKVVAEVEQFKRDKQQYEMKIKIIKELENQQSGPVHVLDELSLNLPEKLWLESLSLKGSLLTLSGAAFANISIVDFINNLKNSPYFQNVQLIESKLSTKEKYRFYAYKLTATVTLPEKGY